MMQKYLFHKFFNGINAKAFQVTYWDHTTEKYGEGEPRFKLVFHKEISITKMLKEPAMTFCEAYMDGHLDFEGDIDEVLIAANMNGEALWKKALSILPKRSSISKQKENVRHHYDLGNDFYSLWLDETMSYSCAYFQTTEDSLHQAQLQKIDHTLKKLQLTAGETLLDIGSGWGWLIIRAAQQYGVKATGITISVEQHKKTEERIAQLGLQEQVQVQLVDYRELAADRRTYDKIVSVGMFEHVGQANYPQFMQCIQALLKDKGLALLHTITRPKEQPVDPWIAKYIFPGGHIPSLREIITLLPDEDFRPIDIESLRAHYAMTLEHWLQGYEQHIDTVKHMYDERFARMWRLYLLTSAASFRIGGIDLHQILFSKGVNNLISLTRQHLYT